TDAEKHSAVKNNLNWPNSDLKRSESGPGGANKMETTTKWAHRTELDGSQDTYHFSDGLLEAGNDRPGWRHFATDEINNTYELQLTQDT
ncbi:hypothetical protein M9458_049938, partial [Cirrhinus mrigala]